MPLSPASRAIVVAGMHRSGTSMTASFLQALGVDMGSRLMAGDANNPKGYFEDWDFVELQQAMFRAACPPGEPGWVEVGWTEREVLDASRLAEFQEAAAQLVVGREALPLWGWKDPRTTLLLDFWRPLLPDARYVLVYRHPWDVVDSLFRAKHPVFAARPDFAMRIWLHYNRTLLAFYRARPEVCLLVSANALPGRLGDFARLLVDKLGLPATPDAPEPTLRAIVDASLMKNRPADDPMTVLYGQAHAEAIGLLGELEAAADIPSGFSAPARDAREAIAALHRTVVLAALGTTAELERCRSERDQHRQAAEQQQRVAEQHRQAAESHRLAAEGFEREAAALRAHATWVEADMRAVLNSTSWRLTAPLRALLARRSRAGRISGP